MKIRPVGAGLFHADWQRDGHCDANSRFSQICERARRERYFRNSMHNVLWITAPRYNQLHNLRLLITLYLWGVVARLASFTPSRHTGRREVFVTSSLCRTAEPHASAALHLAPIQSVAGWAPEPAWTFFFFRKKIFAPVENRTTDRRPTHSQWLLHSPSSRVKFNKRN